MDRNLRILISCVLWMYVTMDYTVSGVDCPADWKDIEWTDSSDGKPDLLVKGFKENIVILFLNVNGVPLNLWNCIYTTHEIVVLKSMTTVTVDSTVNYVYQCILYRQSNQSLVYYFPLTGNYSGHRVLLSTDPNLNMCNICNNDDSELHTMYDKAKLTCGCRPTCSEITMMNSCTNKTTNTSLTGCSQSLQYETTQNSPTSTTGNIEATTTAISLSKIDNTEATTTNYSLSTAENLGLTTTTDSLSTTVTTNTVSTLATTGSSSKATFTDSISTTISGQSSLATTTSSTISIDSTSKISSTVSFTDSPTTNTTDLKIIRSTREPLTIETSSTQLATHITDTSQINNRYNSTVISTSQASHTELQTSTTSVFTVTPKTTSTVQKTTKKVINEFDKLQLTPESFLALTTCSILFIYLLIALLGISYCIIRGRRKERVRKPSRKENGDIGNHISNVCQKYPLVFYEIDQV